MSNTEAIWRILAGRSSNFITRPNTVPPKRPVWTGTKTENAPKGPKNKITPGSRKVIARIEDESNDRNIENAETTRVVLLSAHLRPGPHNRLTGTIQRICRNVIVRQKTNSSTLYTFAPATLTSPKLMKTQKCKQSELV